MLDQQVLLAALDQLAQAASQAPDTPLTRAALAAAVADLERAAGASLGTAESDPLVLLQRRLDRVHRLLAVGPGSTHPQLVRVHLHALRRPGGSRPAPGGGGKLRQPGVPAPRRAGPATPQWSA